MEDTLLTEEEFNHSSTEVAYNLITRPAVMVNCRPDPTLPADERAMLIEMASAKANGRVFTPRTEAEKEVYTRVLYKQEEPYRELMEIVSKQKNNVHTTSDNQEQ